MKLNQVVAIEQGVKNLAHTHITELHKQSQRIEPFVGFEKIYRRKDEDGEDFPKESKRVQLTAQAVLTRLEIEMTKLWDITATKDYANCMAFADVKIGDRTLISQAPVSYLLFLEKQIANLRTFVEALPTLDEAENWQHNTSTGLYCTDTIETHKTKKVQRAIVLYDATKEHPAQTQLISEDIVVGYWQTIKRSGALPETQKRTLLNRIEQLGNAVKSAREEANNSNAPEQSVGAKVFSFLLEEQ